MTVRDECPYEDLNRSNGITCVPMDLCNLCRAKKMSPEVQEKQYGN
jgi:hypothetical protein